MEACGGGISPRLLAGVWVICILLHAYKQLRHDSKTSESVALFPWESWALDLVLTPARCAASHRLAIVLSHSPSPSGKGEDGTRWFVKYIQVLVFFPVMILCVFVGRHGPWYCLSKFFVTHRVVALQTSWITYFHEWVATLSTGHPGPFADKW